MGDIEFNRAAVGINAKKDWEDADNFGQVGAYIDKLPSTGIADPLPAGPNEGVQALASKALNFNQVTRWAAAEYSDACGVLGSGQEQVISNYDETEKFNDEKFQRIASRMSGGDH